MQQAKGYAACARHAVQCVFATNGHRYGEFDAGTGQPTGPLPLADFPSNAALGARYALDKGLDIAAPAAALLFPPDSPAFNRPRYYQDAAIRAAFSQVLQCKQAGQPARVLLSLATGAGKTIIAANLLWRLHEAGRLAKPALFSCDRDELRSQALAKIGRAFPTGKPAALVARLVRVLLHRLHGRPAVHRGGHRAAERGGVLPLPVSSTLFYQMVSRGTRIDEPTHKYKFWLDDYTGVTALFGTDFLTAAPVTRQRPPGEGEGGDD